MSSNPFRNKITYKLFDCKLFYLYKQDVELNIFCVSIVSLENYIYSVSKMHTYIHTYLFYLFQKYILQMRYFCWTAYMKKLKKKKKKHFHFLQKSSSSIFAALSLSYFILFIYLSIYVFILLQTSF